MILTITESRHVGAIGEYRLYRCEVRPVKGAPITVYAELCWDEMLGWLAQMLLTRAPLSPGMGHGSDPNELPGESWAITEVEGCRYTIERASDGRFISRLEVGELLAVVCSETWNGRPGFGRFESMEEWMSHPWRRKPVAVAGYLEVL